jgi:hypothetical protein
VVALARKKELNAWPDFVGLKDASKHGVGGVIVGELKACVPTVFRAEWPQDIRDRLISTENPCGTITNSDLEMAGLLLLFVVMDDVCGFEAAAHVALFSDNSPAVHWVRRMAAKGSLVAGQLLRALALRLKKRKVSPLTPLHIEGAKNAMTDIPSRSFNPRKKWYCADDDDALRSLFNDKFPLPNQQLWTIVHVSNRIFTKVLSVLWMEPFSMEEWQRLPRPGRHTGAVGEPTASLWEWTLIYRESSTKTSCDISQVSRERCDKAPMAEAVKSEVEQFLRRSQPLASRLPWTKG